ncbi:MAG: malto-oligosyltrehalose synthase [Chlamydiia bacterium]|nr:malto-oligosyltrehalose synthase [Chlamydiia bacterium]
MEKIDFSSIPSSVYRLQLNASFPLKKALVLLPYLKKLGIEGVYLSPYYDSYSPHGYDVTDPNQLNPSIGNWQNFEDFCNELKKQGLKQIIDVVPNHMGFRGGKNRWWQDVLKYGPHSKFAHYFDIDWDPDKRELHNRILLPILEGGYGEVLEKKEIQLEYKEGDFFLKYADYFLPLAPHTYSLILQRCDCQAFKKEKTKEELHAIISASPKFANRLKEVIETINGEQGNASSFDALDELIESQFYRLSYWKVASHEINYRRFFNIHELVAIRVEKEDVLEAHHRWIFELIEKGVVDGLRIDHPDGLYDPVCYFERLRKRYPIYTVVEKILAREEDLPISWQVEGTVGYDYLNVLNGIYIDQTKEKKFTQIYENFIKKKVDFKELLYQNKKLFSLVYMVSEVERLGKTLDYLSEKNRYFRDFTRIDLTEAIQEVIACFPVYRSYIREGGEVSKEDQTYLCFAFEEGRRRGKHLDPSIFDFLEKLLLLKLKDSTEYRDFILRFQQLTAPIMAKGLEDTSFYIYNRFISCNEVGGDPSYFGHSIDDFHSMNMKRHKQWPYSFLATSTHDTKRSEDVRMRLNVLSEMPDQWEKEIRRWTKHNRQIDGAPTLNTEYLIYQTLVGAWPKEGLSKSAIPLFIDRFWNAILKAMREAKTETNWIDPNLIYEKNVFSFVRFLFSSSFLKLFVPFMKKIDRYGAWNSLSMTVVKIASPGVVDLYQGNEIWNFKLVDPDNRTPVDYKKRRATLRRIETSRPGSILKLFTASDCGVIKQFIYYRGLNFRKKEREVFLKGDYVPLTVKGGQKKHLIAFARIYKTKVLVVVASRFFTALVKDEGGLPLGKKVWKETKVMLPNEWKGPFYEVFTQRAFVPKQKEVSFFIADLFDTLPFCYLLGEVEK